MVGKKAGYVNESQRENKGSEREREIDSQLLAVGRLMVWPLRSLREFSLRDLIPKRTAPPLYFVRYAYYEAALRERKTDDARPYYAILRKFIILSHIHAIKY